MYLITLLKALANHQKLHASGKKLILPIAISLLGIGLLSKPQEAKAQTPYQTRAITTTDTIWGQGIFITRDTETGDNVQYVDVDFTPDTMIMTTPDTTYHYQTDGAGFGHYTLPVGIDIQDVIKETNNQESQISIYPNPANGFNLTTDYDTPIKAVAVYNLSGQLILQIKPRNQHHTFVNLSNFPNGIYVFRAITNHNRVLTGKFIKNNTDAFETDNRHQAEAFCQPPARQTTSNVELQNIYNYNLQKIPDMKPSKAVKTTLILLTLIFNQSMAQTTTDTIWGQGMFATRDTETGDNVQYVDVYFTPDTMIMVTPDTTYYYQTDNSGIGHYNLPVGIDTITGIKENRNKGTQLTVYPNPSSAFNISTEEGNPLQRITVYTLSGEEVLTFSVNSHQAYVDLSQQPDGIYLFSALTQEHNLLSGKLIKNSLSPSNSPSQLHPFTPSPHPSLTTSPSRSTYTATYKVKWSKEGWYTDSTMVNINEGENDPIIFYMSQKPSGTWRLENIVRDADSLIPYGNNGDSIPAPLAGVKAYLFSHDYTTLIASDTTDSTGVFVFDSIPQNTDLMLSIGDKEGYYSYTAVSWTTPGGLPRGVDSVRTDSVFNTLLKRKITDGNGDTIPAQNISSMNLDGTRYDTMYYWFATNNNGVGFTTTQKQNINNDIHNLQTTEHNKYTYTESPTPRPGNKGIKIMPGTNTTLAGQETYSTPLGEFHPTLIINMWLSNTSYLGTWHEMKRATGYDEVTYYSIMREDAPGYTEKDRKIAEGFIRGYLNMVYHVNTPIPDNIITTYINLNNIRDSTGFNQQTSR